MQVKQKICSNTYLKFSSDLRSILGRLKSVICSHVVDVARPWLHNTILFSQPLSHCRHINSYFRSYILMKIHYILSLTLHHECFARGNPYWDSVPGDILMLCLHRIPIQPSINLFGKFTSPATSAFFTIRST